MKYFIRILIVMALVITICACCKTAFQTKFEYYTNTFTPPQEIVDSIADSYGFELPDYHTWDRDYFFTSDSVIVPSYYYFIRHNKRNYIFTIVSSPDSSIHLIKFRYE